jgi:chromate transporter
MTPLVYFFIFLKASLLSTGGTGNLPMLHADLIGQHVAREFQFGQSLAIGQIAPGPTGLWVISLGFLTDGVRGSLLALLAILLPPFVVLLIRMGYHRLKGNQAAEAFLRGLSLSVIGASAVSLSFVFKGCGVNTASICIAVAAAILTATKRAPILIIFVLAACIGVLVYR